MTTQTVRQWSWSKFGIYGKNPTGGEVFYWPDQIPSLWKPIEKLAKLPARVMEFPGVNREEFLLVYVRYLLHTSHIRGRCAIQKEKRAVFVHRLLWNRFIKTADAKSAPNVEHLLQFPGLSLATKLEERAFLKKLLRDRRPKTRKTHCIFCVPKTPRLRKSRTTQEPPQATRITSVDSGPL